MPLLFDLVEPEQFNRISPVLADPRRMEILERIAGQKELASATLASESAMSQPTISHRLEELSSAGSHGAKSRMTLGYHCMLFRIAVIHSDNNAAVDTVPALTGDPALRHVLQTTSILGSKHRQTL